MIKVARVGAWLRAFDLLDTGAQRVRVALDKAMLQEGQFLRTKVVEGLREQAPGGRAFTPLAPTTLAIRKFRGFGGTKALIVRADLRNAITVTRIGDRALVGVLRSARNRDGRPLVDIAAMNEFGSRRIVTRLTPKARAFLHAAFRAAGLEPSSHGLPSTGLSVVQIPPRPFLAPVFDKYAQPEQVARRFVKRVAKNLGGDFGDK